MSEINDSEVPDEFAFAVGHEKSQPSEMDPGSPGSLVSRRYSGRSQHSLQEVQVEPLSDLERHLQDMTPKIAHTIAKMDVTSPEVVRVTRVYRAFQQRALALRVGIDADLFFKSEQSEKISTFWSHSWHGGHWRKIITLFFLYSSPAAFTLGMLTSLVLCILFIAGVLPGFQRDATPTLYCCWSLCGGCLTTCLVLLLWRPQSKVFLDRICISQEDHDLKAQAIFSLAGLLRRSDAMLILWDPTWTDRLWCLFELAAFLKSKKDQKQELTIRPIFLGPVSIGVFGTLAAAMLPVVFAPVDANPISFMLPASLVLIVGMIVAYSTCSTLRNYFRDLDTMKDQLRSISFDTTRSACCDCNHVSPSGDPLLCDRKVVQECVNVWFGSQAAFEHQLRSEVLEIVVHDLSLRVFTARWALQITMPLLWAFMDLGASFTDEALRGHLRRHEDEEWSTDGKLLSAARFFLQGLVLWLGVVVFLKDLLIVICRISRAKPSIPFFEVLKNLATLCVLGSIVVLMIVCYLLSWAIELGGPLVKTAFFTGCMLLFALCSRLLSHAIIARLK